MLALNVYNKLSGAAGVALMRRSLRLAVLAAAACVLTACATGRNDSMSATPVAEAMPAPVPKAAANVRETAARKSVATVRPPAAAKTTCKIHADSVEWIHLAGQCLRGFAQGAGRAESVDGQRQYSGGFAAGRFDGEGNYDWGNGIRYVGHFVRGAKTGHGTLVYPDNRQYVGAFRDNLYHGAGRYTAADGSSYQGEFLAGQFNGQGVYRWADGDQYTGQFRDDLMQGDGAYVRANGEAYSGQFSNNQRNGAGTYRWPGGDRYTGTFKDNEINGAGTYFNSDGTQYIGNFLNGKKHGWGKLVAANGVFRQQWNHGKKVSEELVPATAEDRPAPLSVNTSSAP